MTFGPATTSLHSKSDVRYRTPSFCFRYKAVSEPNLVKDCVGSIAAGDLTSLDAELMTRFKHFQLLN